MFKQRLALRDPMLGTFLKTPHHSLVEVLATTGLDCLCLDAEHAPFDRTQLDIAVLAARAGGLPTLVRPASNTPSEILAALDCGATGVLIPHIRSADEARAAAQSTRYMPGGRGYAGSSRAAGYGLSTMPDHLDRSARETVAIAQIEDIEALDQIEAIAAVDGLDALFIGRADLTVSLGCRSQDDALVVEAVDRIVSACVRAGRPVGMFLARPTDAAAWREKGASLFLLGSDHSCLRAGVAQLREQAAVQNA